MHTPSLPTFGLLPSTLLSSALLAGLLACTQSQAPSPDDPAAGDSGAKPDDSSEPAPTCGGLAGTACPDGLTCVDDPSDDCDPARGGADCLGVCSEAEPRQTGECEPAAGSGQRYVGHSPDACAAMRFVCEDGEQYFADACGCGCEPAA